jgi:glycosyltransferase involved in cell wall biosynthesis
MLHAVPADTPLIIDGLALGALDPSLVERIVAPIVALVHHPLAHEGGLETSRRAQLHTTEQANLANSAAEPGTDRPVEPRLPSTPPLILSVGSQVRRKGHDVLIRALGLVSDLEWRAVIAGEARDPVFASEIVELIAVWNLGSRLELPGAVDRQTLHELYRSASVFALATRFEGYGMVFAEAMTYGLPIVTCQTGAVPDTVGTGAALLVEPDDHEALADALRRVLTDADLATSLGSASMAAASALPTWKDTSRQIAATLRAVMEREHS